MPSDQSKSADALRALHHADVPLVLPNAWDAASAQAVVEAGFPAVATTSAGVAQSLGFADHQQTPPEEMFAAIARIVAAVAVPVTADIEAGYGLSAQQVAERLLAVGAAGCNLEDTDHGAGRLGDADAHARFVSDVKAVAKSARADLVVNARIDVFLHGEDSAEVRVEEAIRRGRLYRDAGADCVYPIFARGRSVLRSIVAALPGPVNAMVTPGGLGIGDLAELGVRRISYGGGLFAAQLEAFRETLGSLRQASGPS